jgi:hypothetical protein
MTPGASKVIVLLLDRSAISAAPIPQMERFCTLVSGLPNVARAMFAFSEQGNPSLRQVLDELVVAACGRILIVSLLLPAERNFTAWLGKTLQQWQAANPRPWPEIRVAPLLTDHPAMPAMLAAIVQSAGESLPKPEKIAIAHRPLLCRIRSDAFWSVSVARAMPQGRRLSGAICATSKNVCRSEQRAMAPSLPGRVALAPVRWLRSCRFGRRGHIMAVSEKPEWTRLFGTIFWAARSWRN